MPCPTERQWSWTLHHELTSAAAVCRWHRVPSRAPGPDNGGQQRAAPSTGHDPEHGPGRPAGKAHGRCPDRARKALFATGRKPVNYYIWVKGHGPAGLGSYVGDGKGGRFLLAG